MKAYLCRKLCPILLGGLVAFGSGIGSAAAGCAGAEAIDACLVGAWKQTGGGVMEWMKRNMPPGMSIPGMNQGERIIVLDRDGGFRTTPVSSDVTLRMEGQRSVRIEGGEIRTSGRWAAADGVLHLCPDDQMVEGQASVTVPGAGEQNIPLGGSASDGPARLEYTCRDDTLETVQAVPGMGDKITTRYERTGTKEAAQ